MIKVAADTFCSTVLFSETLRYVFSSLITKKININTPTHRLKFKEKKDMEPASEK